MEHFVFFVFSALCWSIHGAGGAGHGVCFVDYFFLDHIHNQVKAFVAGGCRNCAPGIVAGPPIIQSGNLACVSRPLSNRV